MGKNPTQLYQRNSKWTKGVMRSLATTVIVNGYVKTNLQRAKLLRGVVDKLITLGKNGSLSSRRRGAAFLRKISNKEGVDALTLLFGELASRYNQREGGYTRIIKLMPRRGDNTKMAILELV